MRSSIGALIGGKSLRALNVSFQTTHTTCLYRAKPAIYRGLSFSSRQKVSNDMANFHFEVKSGRNGCDHSQYIARVGFHAKREDLVASGHGNLPSWTGDDPEVLWKAAEQYERKNGAVYREATISLPNELSVEQNVALATELVAKIAPGKPHQFAIHGAKSSIAGEANPHLHLMMSDRVDDGIERPADRFFKRPNAKDPTLGGRRKSSGGRNRMEMRDALIGVRKLAAETINQHLAMHGHPARVDHRTLKARGESRKAERYLGPAKIRGMSRQEKLTYAAARPKGKREGD